MGQTLSEPVTSKETSKCENEQFKVGSSCMQGWRINMEDAHTQILALDNDSNAAFFAVYDGHGGARVAEYAGANLHNKIVQNPHYKTNIEEAMKRGFLSIDEDMLNDEEMRDELSGATAITTLIKDKKIYCANVGDSRAIASVNGSVHCLSEDHKPNNEGEIKRIVAAGGWVQMNRVNGNLALSRALGDFIFKKNDSKKAEEQIVTAYPDVTITNITNDFEFLVLACDGIWDVLSNEEVVDFVRNRIAQKMQPETICEELMTRCLAPDCTMGGLGCDNMTVILVCFLHDGQTYEKLAEKCRLTATASSAPSPNNNSNSTFNFNSNTNTSPNKNKNHFNQKLKDDSDSDDHDIDEQQQQQQQQHEQHDSNNKKRGEEILS